MILRRFSQVCLSVFAVLCLLITAPSIAQEANARVSGIVTDPSKAVIPGVRIVAVNVDTNVRFPTKTNGSGVYVLSALPIGDYRVEVEHIGFKSIVEPGIVLHTQDALELNFEMAVGSASETVTVNGGATSDNPAVSMTVSREFVENMPLNGQSFQDLIQLGPGTVSNTNGLYVVNGQRSDSNNFTVDGVASSFGGAVNGENPGYISGSVPAQTALGTTQNLASVDSLQEFTIQTSGYTAEYGRNPGGQVQLTTRSGNNSLHGTLFDYFRNTALDARTFVEDYYDEPKSAERQNDFGGTIGGSLTIPKLYDGKDKTFYFFSYEGLRLFLPNFESEYVPTQAFRSAASQYIQPFLNASPLPNTSTAGDACTVQGTIINVSGDAGSGAVPCDELFAYSYSSPQNVDNISMRLDQSLSRRIHLFARYADTPSSATSGAEKIGSSSIGEHLWTAGLTANLSGSLLDDLRFNYTDENEDSSYTLQSIGGSVPFPSSLLIPSAYSGPFSQVDAGVYLPTTALRISAQYSGYGSWIHQDQIIDSVTWTRGTHSLKFGGDWRRLKTNYSPTLYAADMNIESLTDIEQGKATSFNITVQAPGAPVFDNLSLYAEDHWKMNPRLSLDYGLRWEFNPPPGPSNGQYPVTLTSSNLATAQLTTLGSQPYKTDYHSFAPRLGFAWNAIPSQSHAMTLRGGFGIFFDTAQQLIGDEYTGDYPFVAVGPYLSEVPLPLTDAELTPPSLNSPLVAPYPYLTLASPNLTMPYTEQWNLSVDETLNPKNTFTVSYVGNSGKKLVYEWVYDDVPTNLNFTGLTLLSNGSSSAYNALQVQDAGRLASGLDLVASFTWAHALDNASDDNVGFFPAWGNSTYDIRRSLNVALNYQTPTKGESSWARALTHGWLLANRFLAQSGYPTDIIDNFVIEPNGTQVVYRPDLVPGVPIYLHGSAADVNGYPAPDNWRLNSAAFAQVPTDSNGNPLRQGTLGRNYVRTPSFWSLNTSMQRSFPIYEQLHLNFRVDAFNIFNHPNFNNPDTSLTDSTFGLLTFASAHIGSINSLYSMGSSRSLQLSLKLQF